MNIIRQISLIGYGYTIIMLLGHSLPNVGLANQSLMQVWMVENHVCFVDQG